MEFDVKRCYTAINADELKVWSKVIVGSNLSMLKDCVRTNVNARRLVCVNDESSSARFRVASTYDVVNYELCYLVEEPPRLTWLDLKIGDVIKRKTDGVEEKVVRIKRDYCARSHIHTDNPLNLDYWIDDKLLDLNYEKEETE